MRTPPAGLGEPAVADAVAERWGLRVRRLRYVALGGGSYHWLADAPDGRRFFLTADDLEDKPWLGADPEPAFGGLRAAFGTALALRERAGLPFVVAPVPSLGGETVCRLTPRYSLAVFPFVAGQAGQWGSDLTQPDRDVLAGLLAELHLATPAVAAHALRRGLELHERATLETALAELGRPWSGGPLGELARRELAAKADLVAGWLATFDSLAAHATASSPGVVVTHGEPHPGNMIRAGSGLWLIDWDTVALAPPERDLWMLDDGSPGALARYCEATGRAVDTMAISFYRLAWTLADIASFTGRLRAAHQRDNDTEHALTALKISLEPDPSARTGPFRHLPG